MAFVNQTAQDRLVPWDVRTNNEERGAGIMLGQHVQDARRQCLVRSVVERQCDERLRGLMAEEDVRELPAEPADHRAGPDQG